MRIKITILLLFLSFICFSQTTLYGTFTITSVSGIAPNYTLTGEFNDQTGYWGGDSAQVGDRLFFMIGATCGELRIDTINAASQYYLNVDVTDIDTLFDAPPYGIGILSGRTSNYGFKNSSLNASPDLVNCVESRFKNEVDAINITLPDSLAYGTGTTNYLSRWIAPFTLGTAGISDDGSEIQFTRPTVLYGVNTAAPATFGAFGMNNLGGVYRPTYYNDVGSWINLIGGNLTQNYFGKADSKGNLVNASLTDNGTILDALLPLRLKTYTTAGLPISSGGHTVYNSTASNIAFGGASTWEYPVKSADATGLLTTSQGVTANSSGRLISTPVIRFANNNLGINVTPASTTRVQIDDGSIPSGSTTYYIFQSAGRYGNASAQTGTVYGYFTSLQRRPGAGNMSNVFGYYATVTDINTTGSISGAVGGRFDVTTSATMTSPTAAQASLTTNATGVFGTARSFYATINSNGATTLYRGIDIETPGGAGTITTAQGVRIGSFTGTNRHAIYAEGGNSYHAGSFGFGSGNTSPSATVDVAGDLEVSTRTGTAISIAGWTADNKSADITTGSGLSLSGGELSLNSTVTWLKPELEAGSVDINATTGSDFNIYNLRKANFTTKDFVVRNRTDTLTYFTLDSLGNFWYYNPTDLYNFAIFPSANVIQSEDDESQELQIYRNPPAGANATSGDVVGSFSATTDVSGSKQYVSRIRNTYIPQDGTGSGTIRGGRLELQVSGSSALQSAALFEANSTNNTNVAVLGNVASNYTAKSSLSASVIAAGSSTFNNVFRVELSTTKDSLLNIDNSGTVKIFKYGAGNKTAADLSKTDSGYRLGLATDGTVIEIPDSTPKTHIIARTIYDGDAALPDSTVTVNGTFNAGFWRVPESMDGYTLTKASFGIFDKGDLATTGATYSFGVTKCDGDNANCSNSSSVNFTPSSERELELSTSITLNANDILRVNYQPPQGCGGGCGTENVNGLIVTYTIQQN